LLPRIWRRQASRHSSCGWGYGIYPFDRQIAAFANEHRILIPDRSGYGHSSRVTGEMPLDFHRRAAQETFSFLDALGIESAILWATVTVR